MTQRHSALPLLIACCAAIAPSPINVHYVNPVFKAGDRVVLGDDYKFYDRGDKGTVVAHFDDLYDVVFDGGAKATIPAYVLAALAGDFRILRGSMLHVGSFPTEQSAVDAAEDAGFTAFSVIEVKAVADFRVETIPAVKNVVRVAA